MAVVPGHEQGRGGDPSREQGRGEVVFSGLASGRAVPEYGYGGAGPVGEEPGFLSLISTIFYFLQFFNYLIVLTCGTSLTRGP